MLRRRSVTCRSRPNLALSACGGGRFPPRPFICLLRIRFRYLAKVIKLFDDLAKAYHVIQATHFKIVLFLTPAS